MSTAFPFHVKTMSGDIITLQFDPDHQEPLSLVHQQLAQQMNCHPSQIQLLSLAEEKEKEKENSESFIPSPDELVGLLISDPLVTVETIIEAVLGTLWTHQRYIKYKICVTVFDMIYSISFYYSRKNNLFHPLSAFRVIQPPRRGFLPGIEKKSDIIYNNSQEIVDKMNLPESVMGVVSDLVQNCWLEIQTDTKTINMPRNRK